MNTLITILVVFFLTGTLSSQKKEGVIGKIITDNYNGLIKIRAVSENSSELYRDLNYILISLKKGKSGTSTNKQSGKFSLKPNETRTLSEVNINLQKNDGLKIFLLLKDETTDKLVAKDSVEINPNQFTADVDYIPETELELTGLTVDETKTRNGQMFYDSFFKKYNQMQRKFDGTITVTELPTFGRSTRIIVSLDGQVVHAFLPKPDEEELDNEADRALANLASYSARNSLRNKEFKY